MANRAFRFLFWGFIFILVNFRLQGFDVLPDIVGYILFAIGLDILQKENTYFATAKAVCYPLIFLSLFSIVQFQTKANGGISLMTGLGAFGALLSVLTTVLNMLLVYHICKGVREMAIHEGHTYLADKSNRRWVQYLGLQIYTLVMIMLALALPTPGFLVLLVLLGVAYGVTMAVLMPMLMAECRSRLGAL